MKSLFPDNSIIFREINGIWRRVDSRLPDGDIILADFLALYDLVIPEYCQFCRIIEPNRYIEYRHYGGTIRINITYKN